MRNIVIKLSAALLLVHGGQLFANPQFSGINRITFHDTQYSKAFVGNGFLIKHKQKVYAVTVKHALLEAKTPAMNSVSIKEQVSQWQIHPNQAPQEAVVLGKLLNASSEEKLDMAILQKDWLVFEVEENHSPLTVMTLRDTPLKAGETLTAYGCSYANAQTCKQDVYSGQFIAEEGANFRMTLGEWQPAELRGLSGSPVVDENNRVVGIVSNILPSSSGDGFDFAPANLDYLRKVLARF